MFCVLASHGFRASSYALHSCFMLFSHWFYPSKTTPLSSWSATDAVLSAAEALESFSQSLYGPAGFFFSFCIPLFSVLFGFFSLDENFWFFGERWRIKVEVIYLVPFFVSYYLPLQPLLLSNWLATNLQAIFVYLFFNFGFGTPLVELGLIPDTEG